MVFLKTSIKFSILILLFSLLSCASKQQITLKEAEISATPKLLFLNYKIIKNSKEEKTIKLINQITADGVLKRKPEKEDFTRAGDLQYIILDKDLKEMEKHAIENPLKKTVEFINDFGKFEKRILDLDSAQFTLKLQLQPEATYIVIKELTKTELKKHITTKIN